jgi:DNA-binding CsgD family transcriptional regulator
MASSGYRTRDPPRFDPNDIDSVRKVAGRYAAMYPGVEYDELISELWTICADTGLAPRVVHRRLHDSIRRWTRFLNRDRARARERAGKPVPEFVQYDSTRPVIDESLTPAERRDRAEEAGARLAEIPLSDRERLVLRMWADGCSLAECAVACGVSRQAVHANVAKVKARTGGTWWRCECDEEAGGRDGSTRSPG